jgi:NAD(P)-dependent dehydrogenase (short-subunit alcohol dehydrogenase family)
MRRWCSLTNYGRTWLGHERPIWLISLPPRRRPTIVPVNSLFDVSGKVVLVTGGSRGIGEMIARGFVDAGAKVFISSRKADVGAALAVELSKSGSCTSLPADLSSEAECRRLAGELGKRESHLDVLVNNAGATWGAPMADYDEKAFERVMALNVKAIFHLTKFLRPLLEAAGSAENPSRVINIGSIDGLHVPTLETYAYSASKAAVHQLTRHLAKNLAPNVTVNAIAPGAFESKMMHATLEAFGDEIAAATPLKRIGRPADMAGAAIFLASPAACYITGVILPVDGGLATLA